MIGAGVVGLSVAAHLLEEYGDHLVVTVMADKFSPETPASDKAGGLVLASALEVDEIQKAKVWKERSVRRFRKLYDSEKGGKTGIIFSNGCVIRPMGDPEPAWYKDLVTGYQDIEKPDDKYEQFPGRKIACCATFIISGSEYLSFLLEQVRMLGGVLIKRRVENLSELNSFDVIINCTGLGARELVEDLNMYPSKGLLVSVVSPWIKEWFQESGHHPRRAYIFPRPNEVILGGCNEKGKEDLMIDPFEVQGIIDRCSKLVPSVSEAEVKEIWAGVRPMRKGGVRLEKEHHDNEEDPIVIHNYGHGSYGVTLSWGCAEEVIEIVGEALGLVRGHTLLKSKL